MTGSRNRGKRTVGQHESLFWVVGDQLTVRQSVGAGSVIRLSLLALVLRYARPLIHISLFATERLRNQEKSSGYSDVMPNYCFGGNVFYFTMFL